MSIDSQKIANTSRILGIDFGESKVGLAMAEGETKIAFVYDTISNDKSFLENLLRIIKKEKIERIIIGIPSYINKEKTVYAGEKLGDEIKKNLPAIEIAYQNEMFSTKIAENNLRERGVKKIKRFDDQEAARIILQNWLDETNNFQD